MHQRMLASPNTDLVRDRAMASIDLRLQRLVRAFAVPRRRSLRLARGNCERLTEGARKVVR